MAHLALVVSHDAGLGIDPAEVGSRLRRADTTVATFPRQDLKAASAWAPDRLVVAGGDGSIAPAAAVAGAAGIPLAVVPAGTANNFARAVGLPLDLDRACRLAAEGTRVRPLDLGWLGERPFVNTASAGLASVAAERAVPWKRRLRANSYVIGAAVAAVTVPAVECQVRVDGRRAFAGRAWQLMVASSGAFGAGRRIEGADPADGQLDLVVVSARGRRVQHLVRAWWLARGRIVSQRNVLHARGQAFEAAVPPGTAFNVDGEIAVPAGPVRFSVEPQAFELVVG